MLRIAGILLSALLLLAALALFIISPPRLDASVHSGIAHEPYRVSDEAQRLHQSIPVADLHSDMLLWRRNPVRRHDRGHTDIPRLIEGGVKLQVFTAVTKSPKKLNYDENSADTDNITLLAIAQRWPVASWGSLYERARYQAQRLARADNDYGDGFLMVRTRSDLQKAQQKGALAGIYGIEGAHPLEGALQNIIGLYDAGVRVMGLQHFFDNELGGSLHGKSGAGLTDFGRDAVRFMLSKGIIIDVSHSSEQAVRDVLTISERPVIVSHTGLKGHCDSARNISDAIMKEIADAGGLIGIGFWDGAICTPTVDHIAGAIVYAVDLLGADHVALGSDFDGAVATPLDASELAALTQALLDAGMDEATIRAVMGENAMRFFLENLPVE